MYVRFLALACLALLSLAPLSAQRPLDFQLPPGYLTSITQDVTCIEIHRL